MLKQFSRSYRFLCFYKQKKKDYRNVIICMNTYEYAYVWICMIMYEHIWRCMNTYEYVCVLICTNTYESVRIRLNLYTYEYVWICMNMYENVWVCIRIQDLNPPFGVRHSRKSCFGLCPLQKFWVNDGANFSDARFWWKE